MTEGTVYLRLISNIKDSVQRDGARSNYEELRSLLSEFGEKVRGLADEFHIKDITRPQDFLEFFEGVISLFDTTPESISKKPLNERAAYGYIDADNNYLKLIALKRHLSDEDHWEARRELYQDKYLSLGIFIVREEKSLRRYLKGKPVFFDFDQEYMNEQYLRKVFKDREHMILGAWKAGGQVIQDYLRAKANARRPGGDWQCPHTRELLISHGLFQGE